MNRAELRTWFYVSDIHNSGCVWYSMMMEELI